MHNAWAWPLTLNYLQKEKKTWRWSLNSSHFLMLTPGGKDAASLLFSHTPPHTVSSFSLSTPFALCSYWCCDFSEKFERKSPTELKVYNGRSHGWQLPTNAFQVCVPPASIPLLVILWSNIFSCYLQDVAFSQGSFIWILHVIIFVNCWSQMLLILLQRFYLMAWFQLYMMPNMPVSWFYHLDNLYRVCIS